jgi:hypothetical protein
VDAVATPFSYRSELLAPELTLRRLAAFGAQSTELATRYQARQPGSEFGGSHPGRLTSRFPMIRNARGSPSHNSVSRVSAVCLASL